MRRVNKGSNKWHPAQDHCKGTQSYGSWSSNPNAASTFSKKWSTETFDEMLFATGDGKLWLVAKRSEVARTGTFMADIIKSSKYPNSNSKAQWLNRGAQPEDPWISTIDHGPATTSQQIVYGANSFTADSHGGHLRSSGAVVMIRTSTDKCKCTPPTTTTTTTSTTSASVITGFVAPPPPKIEDFKDFTGLKVKEDKSMIALGAKGDVKLYRSMPETLSVRANLNVEGKTLWLGSMNVADEILRLKALVQQQNTKIEELEHQARCGDGKKSGTNCVCPYPKHGARCEYSYPSSCKSYLEMFPSQTKGKSGTYKILVLNKVVSVHCDMTYSGGGWTALTNPSSSSKASEYDISLTSSVVSGGGSCGYKNSFTKRGQWWYARGYACGNHRINYQIEFANLYGASDLAFVATLQGENFRSLSINGESKPATATTDPYMRCDFYNGNGIKASPSRNGCHSYVTDAMAPNVYPGAISGRAVVKLNVIVGDGCKPDCNHGTGYSLGRILVR